MKWKTIGLTTVFFLFSILSSEHALCAAPYYEGKVIKLIVGTEPGGGYDRTGRLMAKYLPRHIPGKPTVIVENMPGAGHIIAANYIYNVAKPDGLTLGTYNRGLPFAQLTKAQGVRFDMRKYSWIGSVSVDPTAFFLRSDLPYKTVDELLKAKEPIPVASEGLGTTGHQFPLLLIEFAKMNLKMIVYPSGAASRLAIERKEADGRAGSYSSEKPYVERGVFRPMVRGRVSLPEIEKLPVNEDLTQDPKGKIIMAMLSSVDLVGRPFMAPPGTPAEVMKILWDAFAKATKDPDLQAEATKLMMAVAYVPAPECMKTLDYLFNQPEDIIKEFSKYITF
jgi:tripartite-type tricarboxylate transporter receptor subunit TctC